MQASVRVQPVPSSHPYPLSLRSRRPGPVQFRDDPTVAGAPTGQWWPPPALNPSWVSKHAAGIDVMHVHFGYDSQSPDDLEAWCDALDDEGIPLVVTVHDLVNPHFVDQTEHRRRLDVLVPRAARVLTLTDGAAREVRSSWGRPAAVLPHPHVAPLALVGLRPRRAADRFTVGLHLKSLRANVQPTAVVEVLADVLGALAGAELTVHLHREVTRPEHPRHDRFLLRRLEALDAGGRLRLVVHQPHTDGELWEYLRGLDLSVLPYAFGTHSGWLEACHDLGTAVLAPRTGFWVEQQRCLTYSSPVPGLLDADEVSRAVAAAYADRPTWAADREQRRAEQDQVARVHEEIYASVRSDSDRRRVSA